MVNINRYLILQKLYNKLTCNRNLLVKVIYFTIKNRISTYISYNNTIKYMPRAIDHKII